MFDIEIFIRLGQCFNFLWHICLWLAENTSTGTAATISYAFLNKPNDEFSYSVPFAGDYHKTVRSFISHPSPPLLLPLPLRIALILTMV